MIIKLSINIFFASLFLFSCNVSQAKSQTDKPRLVVGIVIDQMTNDYLVRYSSRFSETGFKRLTNGGYYFKNSNYIYVPTVTAAGHSCIYTGTIPAFNGIIANEWYNRETNEIIYCADDKNVYALGIESGREKFSPVNLISPTITDELIKADSNSKVISISLKDRGAIFPGGHLGKSFWFDNISGKFITSSYYMTSYPEWLTKFNDRNLNDYYLNQVWNTLYPIETYTESTADNVPWEGLYKGVKEPVFPYDFKELRSKNPSLIEVSPFGNSMVKELALEVLKSEKLGQGSATDFFCISFSSPDRAGHHFGPNAIEMEDIYLRLDLELSELLDAFDKSVGLGNILFFLTADHGAVSAPDYLNSIGVRAGNITTRDIRDTLNDFLYNKYSINDGVLWIQNLQIYLNHKSIKEQNVPLEKIQNEVSDFLLNIKGINETYTAEGISSGIYSSLNSEFIKNGFIKEKSGDVFMVLDSNWIWNMKRGTTHGSPYKYDRNVPLIWYGWNVLHGETDEFNSQCDIAPTVSDILNINVPSKSIGKSLKGKILKPKKE